MTLKALRGDALVEGDGDAVVLVSLPWIRSMPLSAVGDVTVAVDGERVEAVVGLGARRVAPAALGGEQGWWFLQDRLVLRIPAVERGEHQVEVAMSLLVPYLQLDLGPLVLPLRDRARLELRAAPIADAGRLVA